MDSNKLLLALLFAFAILLASCKKDFKVEQADPINSNQVSSTSASPAQDTTNGGELPPGHPSIGNSGATDMHAQNTATKVEAGSIPRIEGGQTVEEAYTLQATLAGKEIKIRGKVVKFNGQIMGTNWIHIQDGSGKEGTNDLIVTAGQEVKVGQTIIVTGKITYGKDIGSGYKFDAIIENAKITIE
ncbi:MAG: hypothetical protein A2504_10035 [Bdellovibrionales bacterium RIFOXYD12_FULL_39_22]|nr:MAG: hypothetical protein A2385_17670 [Bdellovibrionales bacterium RIFOXYB1_FULL_39_21]OFZ43948.1 MAG: hypothetical protein A2485_04340 [Bdellovibrionales bacterium RIFOXYC12_FULL_39_17]OFZ48320.1 MAG: hypothetical protein A2404_01755 [Bdellovibrionales bacterium RIFOXYC1_FULL_39_130]OFZ76625.1 MAG: hypothetical protein A2560_17350 [Bdellovibrionales bacterium RIFOXYD1_FULL_39_84]OFZ94911.1 MAG: hypothetical protein A2504_10035 [Bdellovibrionales bacterium RIFOXYD12_FULL_39_22]HLE12667.1 hy